jgi:hypothetical protein
LPHWEAAAERGSNVFLHLVLQVLPSDYVAALSIGQVLDNNDLNPLIWPPGAPPPNHPASAATLRGSANGTVRGLARL